MTNIHERIKAARDAKGFSMQKLAELLGIKAWQTIQQWENGGTAPKRKRLEQVANILGVTVEYLLQGSDPDGDHAPIKLIDAKASAGTGQIIYSDDVKKMLMFRRDWLAKNDAKPNNVVAFPVDGDSMVDEHIIDGAVVLVDTTKREPLSKRLYVLWINEQLYVKQLIKKNGLWFAHSRNAAKADEYPDIQIDIDDRIVGRAFWCGFGL
tara:strand:+ start:219 stop:845 length:627 start_codon:yes stop_codon:yes gene_type:complete